MIQSNYFTDNPDLQDHFENIIDWNEVVSLYENNFSDHTTYQSTQNPRLEMAPATVADAIAYYRETLRSFGEIAGMHVSQVAKDVDAEGVKFVNGKVIHPEKMIRVIEKYREAGLPPLGFQRKYGGLGLPNIVKTLAAELIYRSDSSISIAMGSMGLAAILEKFAGEEICQKWIPKIILENYCVAMGLSEPDYGSDLPDIKTRAEQVDGKWILNGTKRFQTVACGLNGGPALMLALARTGSPTSGARGLSFFIVDSSQYQIVGIEKKLGLKASATCEVILENSVGELVGEQGYGLVRYVIGMLNGARLSVASQGVGISTAAFYEARKYAHERIQFGKPIAQIPAVASMLAKMEREIFAMRCLMLEAGLSVDRYQWDDLRSGKNPDKDTAERLRFAEKLANILTPISKYYNSEMCNELVDIGLQVFGGAGFTEDFDLARLYRDARITNIYDGTTQIQINAAIGGVVAGMSPNGVFRNYLDDLSKNTSIAHKELLTRLRTDFESLVEMYKSISDKSKKESKSFEVVEASARLVNSLLIEKSLLKSQGDLRKKRTDSALAYHIDSLAVCAANLVKLSFD